MASWAKRVALGYFDRAARRILLAQNTDIEFCVQRRALEQTARYVEKNLGGSLKFDNKYDVLAHALGEVDGRKGLYMEFGVYRGETINFIASRAAEQKVYGFDSFQGLPEFWRPGFEAETFRVASLPAVERNVNLQVGWFEESLPQFLDTCDEDFCAFVHIDCDLYSSTATVFKYLRTRIRTGTILVFDEYFNYPSWRNHEYRAFQEFIQSSKMKYKYIAYNRLHEQVAVQIL